MTLNDVRGFIFNWRNYTATTKRTYADLSKLFRVDVINSSKPVDGWFNLGDSAYYSDQFKTALEMFTDEKLFFHTQADATSTQWGRFVKAALEDYEKYNWGIYYPHVWRTAYMSQKLNIRRLEPWLHEVLNGDETTWFIDGDVIREFKEKYLWMFEDNKYGWGWDLCICWLCTKMGKPVLRNYAHMVRHKMGSTYGSSAADAEFDDLKKKMTKYEGLREYADRCLSLQNFR